MTNAPQRDLKKEFTGFMSDVEGTAQLLKEYDAESRTPQKDGLLKKVQTKAYTAARALQIPGLPAQASGVALDDAKNYLNAHSSVTIQYASNVLSEQGGLEELVGGLSGDKLEKLAFSGNEEGAPYLKHSDKAYQTWANTYASLQGQKNAYVAFADRVKNKKLTQEDQPIIQEMTEKAAGVKAQERMLALKQEGKLSHDNIQMIGNLVAQAVKRMPYDTVIADGLKAQLAELDTKYKAHIETGVKDGKTLRGYVEGSLRPMVAGKTDDFNLARSLLYSSLK